jgi:Ty3 transposon capsid-like protein/Zinc knuckle
MTNPPAIPTATSSTLPTTTMSREVKIRPPLDFVGDRTQTKKFLQSIDLFIQVNPDTYDTDEKKVALALSFMTEGTAEAWRETKIDEYIAANRWPTWNAFKTAVRAAFDPINEQGEAVAQLKLLKQDGPVDDYVAKFRVLAPKTGITDQRALLEYFYDGLDPKLLERIYTKDTPPTTLEEWYTAAAVLDTQMRRVQNLIKGHKDRIGATAEALKHGRAPQKPEPIGLSRLTMEQKNEYQQKGLCFRCGKPGHMSRDHSKRKPPGPAGTNYRKPIFPRREGKDGRQTYTAIRALMAELPDEEREEVINAMEKEGF